MPSPAWYDADSDDADRHRIRDAIARLEGRGCCDDVRAENERLREVVDRVEALAGRILIQPAETWGTPLHAPPPEQSAGYIRGADDALTFAEHAIRAALADPAPVAPARHDDTQDGAR